jgi:hypothetical protein
MRIAGSFVERHARLLWVDTGRTEPAVSIGPSEFLKIAPYLHNYFVLIGFIVSVIAGIWLVILKSLHRAHLSKPDTSRVLATILRYTFWLAVFSIASGLVYTAYQARQSTRKMESPPGPIQQQAGDCSVVQNGTGNSASVNCPDKMTGVK